MMYLRAICGVSLFFSIQHGLPGQEFHPPKLTAIGVQKHGDGQFASDKIISSDGKRFYENTGPICCWSTETWKQCFQHSSLYGDRRHWGVMPNDHWIVTVELDQMRVAPNGKDWINESRAMLRVWNTSQGQLEKMIVLGHTHARALAIHPGSNIVAVSTGDECCKLVDIAKGQILRTIRARPAAEVKDKSVSYLDPFRFSPCGQYLSLRSRTGSYIWDAKESRLIAIEIRKNETEPKSCDFGPDSLQGIRYAQETIPRDQISKNPELRSVIKLTARDQHRAVDVRKMHLHDVRTGKIIKSMVFPGPVQSYCRLPGTDWPVTLYEASYSGEGKILPNRELVCWDIETGKPRFTWKFDSNVKDFAFCPTGSRLLTYHADGFLRYWSFSLDDYRNKQN